MSTEKLDESGVVEITGKVMVGTIIALFLVLIFVFFLHLYAKWFWYRRQQGIDGHNNRRRQEQHSGVTVLRRGLEASFIKTLPVVQFDSKDFKDGLECAVCLSELEQGEKTRILPKCNHAFHLECIDMWFHSHSTCPICRNHVSEQTEVSLETLLENNQTQEQSTNTNTAESHNFPTNVLFWGDETEVSTLTSQLEEANNHHQPPPVLASSSSSSQTNNDRPRPDLVIDIPREIRVDEDVKSPVSSRITSLMRILSSRTRFNPFSPGSANVDQFYNNSLDVNGRS